MRIAPVLLVMAILAGCGKPIEYEYQTLGTVGITNHKTPFGGLLRRLCQFRVEVGEHTLGYAGSSTMLTQHNKCLTMKDGDQVTVTQRTRISGDDRQPAVRYFGKVGEVEFVLQ